MKSRIFTRSIVAGVAALTLALGLSSCGSQAAQSDEHTIKIGASPAPHAEILKSIENQLEKDGYKLQVVEYSDYIQPNVALADAELDANYFQHKPYLDNYNEEKGAHLVSAGAIHFEPLAIFASKTTDLKDLPEKAKVAVPSDPTNEARALLLLQQEGLIKLKDNAGLTATPSDIAENPKNLQIIEAEAASLPRVLEDCNIAVINGNFALSAGLDSSKILASEGKDSQAAQTYANIIAVRADQENSPKIQALLKALTSAETKDFIASQYKQAVIPVF